MKMKFKLAAVTVLVSSSVFAMSDANAASIPSDAEKYNGHYYRVYNRSMTWREARNYCRDLGGHLVTITSRGEQNFVEDLLSSDGKKNCYWLGGYKESKHSWRWVTGESFSYNNWAKGQPDNYTSNEDSLMIYRRRNPNSSNRIGEWNDISYDGECNGESFFGERNFGFICEWDSKRSSSRRDRYDDDDYDYDDNDDYDRDNRRNRRGGWWNR